MNFRILIAEDQQIMREALKCLLSEQPSISVIGDCGTGREAIQLAMKIKPDIIIMDVCMPDLNGIEATRQVLDQNPYVKVIVLSGYDNPQYVGNMLRVGAKGYILKGQPFKELMYGISEVMQGRVYLSAQIASVVVHDYIHLMELSENDSAVKILTPREREIFLLLTEGLSICEIESKVFLNRKTIETHRRNIMKKLQVENFANLMKYAIREGYTQVE